ncbi:hypothetical protein Busp01_27840 [Trinickia caryophylli]|nr:hypothetical protein C0Z17_10810 [Trinickia caryophylli]GLU32942.1 hypothetical protein Busp01_27840 [Trinickia caryophylli]
MPRRREVARDMLRDNNIDPQQKFTVIYRYPHSEKDELDVAAEDIYMEYGLNIPVLDGSVREYPKIIRDLPSLNKEFDKRVEAHIENSIRDGTQEIVRKIAERGITDGEKFAVSQVKSAKRSEDWISRSSTDGAIMRIENNAGESKFVAIVPTHPDLVIAIPENEEERLEWIQLNEHLFFGDELGHLEWGKSYVTFDYPETSLLDDILGRSGTVAESNAEDAAKKISDHIFRSTLMGKKKEAYEETEMEGYTNMHRTMMFPPYGIYEAKRQHDLGDDPEAAKQVVMVAISALPTVVGGVGSAVGRGSRITRVVIKVGKTVKTVKTVVATGGRAHNTVRKLARVVTRSAQSRVGRRLARGGVCWDAVINFEKEAGLIPASRAQALHTVTRAGQFSEFLKNARQVATPTEFAKVSSGQRIGFIGVRDGTLKHAMVSTGHGKAIGVNNGFLDAKLSPGWTEIDLTRSLRWKDGLVHSADGKVSMRLMVANPA